MDFWNCIDDCTSQNHLGIEYNSSKSYSNSTNAYAPEPYCRPSLIPDGLSGHFGNTTTEMMPWLDTGSFGHQFEQTLPFYDFYGSTTEIACSGTPRPNWIQYYDTDAQNNKITGTNLRVPEDYQNQQSPGFEHVTNGGRCPISFITEGNSSTPIVRSLQATRYSDNGNATLNSVWHKISERSPEIRPKSPDLWLKNNQTKPAKQSDNNQCPICDQVFKRRDNIKPHVSRKHPLDYDSLYVMSRSTSTRSSPAAATNHLSAHGDSLATHDLGCDGSPPSTIIVPLEQGSQTPSLSQPDVTCSGYSTVPQKRSLSRNSLGEPAVSDCSERRSAPRFSTNENYPGRPLACPFQKRNPSQHQRCFALSLQRIKDVKQHIYRCHAKPEYYCASCYEVFDTANDRDKHSRRRECRKLDRPSLPHFEGITEEQRKQLNEKSNRTMNIEEQWFQIWAVLFQDAVRPRSVYLGNCLEEVVPLLREKWRRQGSSIMAHAGEVDARQLSCAMNCAMDIFFKSLEGDTAGYGKSGQCAALVH